MVKKGDTLIEVTLAIGIFSMIAIAIASVMNGGVSDAQTSLETTLAREQIDSQAEALRFIHSSYINYKSFKGTKNPYIELWRAVIDNAATSESINAVTDFTPTSCEALYDESNENSIFKQNAFIINLNAMGGLMSEIQASQNTSSAIKQVVIRANENKAKFITASTYPRLVHAAYTGESDSLISKPSSPELRSAEGIYIVAVKDNKSTLIINENGQPNDASAFYDFYIRTCWYGANSGPSTISTVIRLNDPSDSIERQYQFTATINGTNYGKNNKHYLVQHLLNNYTN